MRAALEEAWPALSHLYGLRPWDTERLTPGELNAYMDDIRHRSQEAASTARRHQEAALRGRG